jgi:hypothetical protein
MQCNQDQVLGRRILRSFAKDSGSDSIKIAGREFVVKIMCFAVEPYNLRVGPLY